MRYRPESSRVICDTGLARAYAAALREIAAAADVPDGLKCRCYQAGSAMSAC